MKISGPHRRRSGMRWTRTLLLAVCCVCAAVLWAAPQQSQQTQQSQQQPPAGRRHALRAAAGDELQWKWSKEKATLQYCIKTYLKDFDVEFSAKGFGTPITIRSKKENIRLVYEITEWYQTALFARLDDKLFIAEYSPISSGCNVIAIDLSNGRRLWTSHLNGIGPTTHSEYLNRVNIDIDDQRVIVYGNEAHGRYVEVLDIENGKMIANRKFPPDIDSFER